MTVADLLRDAERAQCLLLLQGGGPGWFEYTIDKAARLEKDEPVIHRGLLREVTASVEAANAELRMKSEPAHSGG